LIADHTRQYEAWKEDKSIALSRFLGQFAIVSVPTVIHMLLSDEPTRRKDPSAPYCPWPRASPLTAQFKSATSGHTGSLGEISKQEIENVFFGDEKNVKDKSVE
jgi:hypothetical protein